MLDPLARRARLLGGEVLLVAHATKPTAAHPTSCYYNARTSSPAGC